MSIINLYCIDAPLIAAKIHEDTTFQHATANITDESYFIIVKLRNVFKLERIERTIILA